jgi:hypothetical protein
MSNLRNSQLLQQMQRHPLRSSLAKCFDIAETFQGDVEYIALNDGLSPRGRDDERQAKLRAAIRDLRDSRAPIAEMQQKLDTKRAGIAMPPFDPKDIVGFLRRQELRAALRSMAAGQRELTLNDPAFADAMLEQPPVLSGLFLAEDFKGTISPEIQTNRDIVAAAKQKRLANLFGPQLAEIDELEKTVTEANMIADLARNDLQLHSGLDRRVFEEFVKPVETKAATHWLRKDADGTIRVIDLEKRVGRVATEREILDGKYYRDHAEYLADRAA